MSSPDEPLGGLLVDASHGHSKRDGQHEVSWMMEAAGSTDNYSDSLFVIEVDWMPTAIFKAKWHREAEVICQNWVNNHWEKLVVKGRLGMEFPPLIKVAFGAS